MTLIIKKKIQIAAKVEEERRQFVRVQFVLAMLKACTPHKKGNPLEFGLQSAKVANQNRQTVQLIIELCGANACLLTYSKDVCEECTLDVVLRQFFHAKIFFWNFSYGAANVRLYLMIEPEYKKTICKPQVIC